MDLILGATNSVQLKEEIKDALQYNDFKNEVLDKLNDLKRERQVQKLSRGNFIIKNVFQV